MSTSVLPPNDDTAQTVDDPSAEAAALLMLFDRISDPEIRQSILAMLQSITNDKVAELKH